MEEIVNTHSERKRREELKLFKQLKADYKIIEDALVKEAERLFIELPDNPALAIEHERVRGLLFQVRTQLNGYAENTIIPTVAEGMVQSSFLGEQQSLAILRSIFPEVDRFGVLPVRTIEAFTRQLTTGPLGRLMLSFGEVAASRARRDILVGLTLGHNPKKLARTLRHSLGTSYTRSLLIARTETMRAHREGTRQSYRANAHLVKGWVWHAAASERTCAACWAMHGSLHPLDEPMVSHPACRCSMVPKTRTWKEMGFHNIKESVDPVPAGEDLFAQQSESTQRAVLGNNNYERYKRGEVKLSDFVAVKPSAYGNTITKKTPK